MESTIGAFEEETYAYHVILGLAIGYPIAMILVGGLQFGIYLLYNRSQHPFNILVKDFKPAMKTESQNGQNIELKPVLPKKPTFSEEPNESPESEPLIEVHETTPDEQISSKSMSLEVPEASEPSQVPEVPEMDKLSISEELVGDQDMPKSLPSEDPDIPKAPEV